MSKLSRHGFTLIEMLVVLSILLVLISLLLPVVGRAKSRPAQWSVSRMSAR